MQPAPASKLESSPQGQVRCPERGLSRTQVMASCRPYLNGFRISLPPGEWSVVGLENAAPVVIINSEQPPFGRGFQARNLTTDRGVRERRFHHPPPVYLEDSPGGEGSEQRPIHGRRGVLILSAVESPL